MLTDKNKHMKKYTLPIIIFILGIISFITFGLIGSEVSEDGMLIEQFGLIPIGYLLITISIIWSIIILIIPMFQKTNKKP